MGENFGDGLRHAVVSPNWTNQIGNKKAACCNFDLQYDVCFQTRPKAFSVTNMRLLMSADEVGLWLLKTGSSTPWPNSAMHDPP